MSTLQPTKATAAAAACLPRYNTVQRLKVRIGESQGKDRVSGTGRQTRAYMPQKETGIDIEKKRHKENALNRISL